MSSISTLVHILWLRKLRHRDVYQLALEQFEDNANKELVSALPPCPAEEQLWLRISVLPAVIPGSKSRRTIDSNALFFMFPFLDGFNNSSYWLAIYWLVSRRVLASPWVLCLL